MGGFDSLFEKTAAVPPLKKWEKFVTSAPMQAAMPLLVSTTLLGGPIVGAVQGQKIGTRQAKEQFGSYKQLEKSEKKKYRDLIQKRTNQGAFIGLGTSVAVTGGLMYPVKKARAHAFKIEQEAWQENFNQWQENFNQWQEDFRKQWGSHGAGGGFGFKKPPEPVKAFGKPLNEFAKKSDVKKEFYRQAKANHPDVGGSEEIMKKLNNEWDDIQKSDWFNKLAHDAEWEEYIMSKTSAYEALFEKVASTAWKRRLGTISSDNVSSLRRLKIIDDVKDIAGLNAGTDNILNKLNAKVFENDPKGYANFVVAGTWKDPAMKKAVRASGISARQFRDAIMRRNVMSGGYTSFYGPQGDTAVSRGNIDALANLLGIKISGASIKKYADAVANRHEATEALVSAKIPLDPKRYYNLGGIKLNFSKIFTHASPEVLVHESANIAKAPSSVKKFFTEVRDSEGSRALLDKTIGYGKSPIFDKKKAKELVDMQIEATKKNMGL
jgi:hypothetical protein